MAQDVLDGASRIWCLVVEFCTFDTHTRARKHVHTHTHSHTHTHTHKHTHTQIYTHTHARTHAHTHTHTHTQTHTCDVTNTVHSRLDDCNTSCCTKLYEIIIILPLSSKTVNNTSALNIVKGNMYDQQHNLSHTHT